MHKLDNDLSNLKNENVAIPETVLKKIDFAYEEIRAKGKSPKKEKCKLKYKRYTLAAALILAVLISFTPPAKATIKNIIFSFQSKGIENAIENNYIQSITNEKLSTNKFDISLKNVLVDSANIALDFEILLKDNLPSLIKSTDNLDIYSNISLYDENGKVVFKDGIFGPISGGSTSINRDNLDNNTLNFKVLLDSNKAKIPSIKKLNINAESLVFRDLNKDKIIFKSEFKWNPSIELDKKFYDSKPIK